MEQLIYNAGFPIWDNTYIIHRDDKEYFETYAFTPYINQSDNFCTGFMFSYFNSFNEGVDFQFIDRDQVLEFIIEDVQFLNDNSSVFLLAQYDNELFQYSDPLFNNYEGEFAARIELNKNFEITDTDVEICQCWPPMAFRNDGDINNKDGDCSENNWVWRCIDFHGDVSYECSSGGSHGGDGGTTTGGSNPGSPNTGGPNTGGPNTGGPNTGGPNTGNPGPGTAGPSISDCQDCIGADDTSDEFVRLWFLNSIEANTARNNFISEAEEIIEIENGISIIGFDLWETIDSPVIGTFAGQNENRDADGNPDLEHGLDGDLNLINPISRSVLEDAPLTKLSGYMRDLLHNFGAIELGDQYLSTFLRNTEVVPYYSEVLSRKVFNHVSVNNFIKVFANEFESQIIEHNGILVDMELITLPMDEPRPKFNLPEDYLNGLKILVNDTEHTLVYVDDLSVDFDSGDWSASFYLRIEDNFGLDDDDLIKFQNISLGFSSWWMMQHVHNIIPFISDIRVKINVAGNVND